jgi:protein TonB
MAAHALIRQRDPAGDRLATAIFIAALVHGLAILGVKFSTPPPDARPLPTLEILLVPSGPDDLQANERAPYLAQRNQRGSGLGDEARRSSLPEARPDSPPDAPEMPVDPELERELRNDAPGQASVLARRALDAERLPTGADTLEVAPVFYARPAPPPPTVGLNASANDRDLYLRGLRSTDGKLLADTRESAIAAYLEGWKRRIERVGTVNFPNEARRRGMSGNPVLEVAIRADGSLQGVIVRRTSGHRELDQAAVGIVRLAAPFDPFSTALRDRYPVLRFAYEWQFLNGRLGGDGTLFTSDP